MTRESSAANDSFVSGSRPSTGSLTQLQLSPYCLRTPEDPDDARSLVLTRDRAHWQSKGQVERYNRGSYPGVLLIWK